MTLNKSITFISIGSKVVSQSIERNMSLRRFGSILKSVRKVVIEDYSSG